MSEWIKFDLNDKNTWPSFGEEVLICYIHKDGDYSRDIDVIDGEGMFFHSYVTHWMPPPNLPQTEGE